MKKIPIATGTVHGTIAKYEAMTNRVSPSAWERSAHSRYADVLRSKRSRARTYNTAVIAFIPNANHNPRAGKSNPTHPLKQELAQSPPPPANWQVPQSVIDYDFEGQQ